MRDTVADNYVEVFHRLMTDEARAQTCDPELFLICESNDLRNAHAHLHASLESQDDHAEKSLSKFFSNPAWVLLWPFDLILVTALMSLRAAKALWKLVGERQSKDSLDRYRYEIQKLLNARCVEMEERSEARHIAGMISPEDLKLGEALKPELHVRLSQIVQDCRLENLTKGPFIAWAKGPASVSKRKKTSKKRRF